MDIKKSAVYALYSNKISLENAVNALKNESFQAEDISVLFSSTASSLEGTAVVQGTKLSDGTAVGAVSGAVIGGVLGWLAGIGSIAIPGVGPLIAAGPIMALLAGTGVGGSVGGVAGGLIGLGFPEYEAKKYEGRIKSGKMLLTVYCEAQDLVAKAKEIIKRSGGEDMGSIDGDNEFSIASDFNKVENL